MNLTALAELAATQGQAAAEGLMTDTCTITRPSGTPTLDPDTGDYTGGGTITVYSGACRVKPRISRGPGDQVEAGERPVQIWPYVVSLPIAATGVEVDDDVMVDSSALDPELTGRGLVVKTIEAGSQITARRLGCVEQETPGG